MMDRNTRMFADNKFVDLKAAADFFSTAGSDMWTFWVYHCKSSVFRFLDKPEPRLSLGVPCDSESYKRQMPCHGCISALIERIDDLSARFPKVMEPAELMKMRLRRFFDAVCDYVSAEDACAGEGDLKSIDDAASQLRDAGDAFAASIMQANALGDKEANLEKRVAELEWKNDDAKRLRFYDAVVRAYWKEDEKGSLKKGLSVVGAVDYVFKENIKWAKGLFGDKENADTIRRNMDRWRKRYVFEWKSKFTTETRLPAVVDSAPYYKLLKRQGRG